MKELFECLQVVFQITNTSYGLGIWIVFAILCCILSFVIYRPKKITLLKICRALLYAYVATYSLIFILLAHIVGKTKWIVLLWIVVALPVIVKRLIKHIYAIRKRRKIKEDADAKEKNE